MSKKTITQKRHKAVRQKAEEGPVLRSRRRRRKRQHKMNIECLMGEKRDTK